MQRFQLFYTKKQLVVFSTILVFVGHFFLLTNLAVAAADSLSYSGRLVQTSGAPVSGNVHLLAELAYATSTTAGTVVCSQNFPSVALSNGVFHLKLNLSCTGALAAVLAQVPDGKYAAIRVTNLSAVPVKVYDFQELNSMPFANVAGTAKQLVQMTATPGQVLHWTGTEWGPITLGAGTLTSVTSGGLPIRVSEGAAPVVSIDQANGSRSGYLSAADWTIFNSKQGVISGGALTDYYRGNNTWAPLNTTAVPEAAIPTNLYFTNSRALGVPLDGFAVGAGAIIATDSVLTAFGKTQGQIDVLTTAGSSYLKKNSATGESITGVVNVGTIGSLNLTYTPTNATDATNKSYVDSKVSDAAALKLNKAGDTMAGALTLNSDLIIKNGTHTVTISGDPAATATYSLTLPPAAGAAGNVLKTDATGKLSWADLSSATTVTTNANMTGPITSVGNATAIASQTGTGSTFVMSASPTITTPTFVGVAIGSISGNAETVSTNANLTGDVTSVGNATTIGTSGTRDATTYLAGDNTWKAFADNVFAAPLPALSTAGINHGNQTIAATDPMNVAFNKLLFAQGDYISKTATSTVNGTLAINSLTGDLVVPDAPFGLNSAVNKTYVQAALTELDGRKQNTSTLGADVQAVLLSGLTAATNAVITAADSIVLAFSKLQNQISNKANTTDGTQTITASQLVALKVTGLNSPVDNSDAVNRGYVDSFGQWTKSGSDINRASGNVGVGVDSPLAKLHVAGGVQIGDDAGACNAGRAGTLKYVSSILYFCEGTTWKIVQLITPTANVVLLSGTPSGMNVVGPGTPAYGSNVVFTYQNSGTASTATISTSLSSATNFEIVTDNCNGVVLTPSSSCTITVKPKATADGALAANLVVNW